MLVSALILLKGKCKDLMSENVSNYVFDLHEFENIAGKEDSDLIKKLKHSFVEWREMTNELSSYAYLVSNTDLINVLSAMELNLHRLDDDSSILLVAKQTEK